MARKQSGADLQDIAVRAEPSVPAKQPGTNVPAATNSSRKQKRSLRQSLSKFRGTKKFPSSGKRRRRHPLAHLQSDKLCLDICNKLLPKQFMSELRVRVQGGSEPFAAVQQAANQQLENVSQKDVQKLFLAAAAAASTSCGAVHIMKRLACCVAKPLRLGSPVGFVTRVLMPTPLYGPLLAAYVTVTMAQGAIRQLKSNNQLGAATAAGDQEVPGTAGEDESNGVVAHAPGSSSSSSSSRRVQQQQQQPEGGKPWWAIWKRKQQNKTQQQQQQQQSSNASEVADPAAAAAAASTTARSSSSTTAAAASSSSSVPGVNHVVLRKATLDHQASKGLNSAATQHDTPMHYTAAAAAAKKPAAAGLFNTQQQQQGFATPQLRTTGSPFSSPRTSNDVTDFESNDPPTPARYNSIGSKEPLPPAHLPNIQLTSTAREQHSSSSDATAAAGCSGSPTELDSQVGKLQRRWSSGDHEVLAEDALRFSQVQAQPSRPPVFSRLASGKPACRITAAAAEQLTEQGSGGSGSGNSFSGKVNSSGRSFTGLSRGVSLDLGAAAAAAATAAAATESPKNVKSLHKAYSDVARSHSVGPLAASAAAAAAAEDVGAGSSSPRQQQQQEVKAVNKNAQSQFKQKMQKGIDWGHRLFTGEP